MTVPIATSPGRSGFSPQLSLSYDSGAGNGIFGFGWSLSIPSITRKTDKGLPQYRDAEESDVFILSGSEDLVPVLEQDAQGEITPVPVVEGGLVPNLPLVVLIDSGTASAAEIVSGALQDAGRAELVGETTFGTGTVLNEFSLSDGSALLLATEEWLTPEGRLIWHQGIAPDVQLAMPQGTSPLLPEAEVGMTSEQVQNSGDAQLLGALELLSQSVGQQPTQ